MSEENSLWRDTQAFSGSRSSDSLRSRRLALFPAQACKHPFPSLAELAHCFVWLIMDMLEFLNG